MQSLNAWVIARIGNPINNSHLLGWDDGECGVVGRTENTSSGGISGGTIIHWWEKIVGSRIYIVCHMANDIV
jgi:hypothetical protein